MNAKTMSKSEQILARIEALKTAAKEAEKREREQRKRAIAKAAMRAGVDKLDIPISDLEAEFRRLVERHQAACVNTEPRDDRDEGTHEVFEYEQQDRSSPA